MNKDAALLLAATLFTFGAGCERDTSSKSDTATKQVEQASDPDTEAPDDSPESQSNQKQDDQPTTDEPARTEPDSDDSAETRSDGDDFVSEQLTRLRDDLDCPSDNKGHQIWCLASAKWPDGTAAELPDGEHAFLGFTAGIETDRGVQETLQTTLSMSTLLLEVGENETTAEIRLVNPDNDAEKKMMEETIASLYDVFVGDASSVRTPRDLLDFLDTLSPDADFTAQKAAHGWTWEGDMSAELRRAGDYWVAVEVADGESGVVLSIFTDEIDVKGSE